MKIELKIEIFKIFKLEFNMSSGKPHGEQVEKTIDNNSSTGGNKPKS